MNRNYDLYEYQFDGGHIKFYARQNKRHGNQLKILFSSIDIKKDDKYINGFNYLNRSEDKPDKILYDYINFQNVLNKHLNGIKLYSDNIYSYKLYRDDINDINDNIYDSHLYNNDMIQNVSIPKTKLSFYELHEIARNLRDNLSHEIKNLLLCKSSNVEIMNFNENDIVLETRNINELFDFSQLLDDELDKSVDYWIWKSKDLNIYNYSPDEIDLLSFMELVVSHYFRSREEIEKIKFVKKI